MQPLELEAQVLDRGQPAGDAPSGKRSWAASAAAMTALALAGGAVGAIAGRASVAPSAAELFPDLFGIVQSQVDKASMTFVSANMSEPRPASVRLQQTLTMHHPWSPFKATMHPCTMVVSSPLGAFGELESPEIAMPSGSGDVTVNIDTRMSVTNAAHFAAATKELMNGHTGHWTMSCDTKVDILMMTFSVSLRKTLAVPPVQLQELTVDGSSTKVRDSSKDTLTIESASSYMSTSPLTIWDFGELNFDLYAAGVRLGQATMANFRVVRGLNAQAAVSKIERTAQNADAISAFFSAFQGRKNQTLTLRGPVAPTFPWLDVKLQQQALLTGLTESTVLGARMTVDGLQGGKVIVNGQSQEAHWVESTARNPFNVDLKMGGFNMQTWLNEPIGFVLNVEHLEHPVCEPAYDFSVMTSATGVRDGKAVFSSQVTIPAGSEASFNLPAQPHPGLGPMKHDLCYMEAGVDCCYAGRALATVCRAEMRKRKSATARMAGNATVAFGAFSTRVEVVEDAIPITWEAGVDDLPEKVLGLFTVHPLTCDAITDYLVFEKGDVVSVVAGEPAFAYQATVDRQASPWGVTPVLYCLTDSGKDLGCKFQAQNLRLAHVKA